ncbi:Sterol 3-beta-glucosyltransferase UGT80B1 [Colletotrichum spinosum]|uniref:Sterol 3-beta-glucosyltransferase UGT80B1 n=1 Tax=Colletotrichum spinosum TaxID=1347390 RepID=A0A4R8PS90_9PEZI|nr:Sterol 3-beta-glucosyltransferase UGT80B1 [Colletotrichum spinosum]
MAYGHIDINFQSKFPEPLTQQLPPLPSEFDTVLPILTPKRVPSLNVVNHVVGSRDVQPFIAFGTALRRHGHRVRLATHNNFDKFVRDTGLEFFPIGGDPEDLMSYMVRNPGLIPSMESLKGGDVGKKRRKMRETLHGCWRSCIDPDPISSEPFVADAIIANPPSFAHAHCAQALCVPAHIMFTMPWTATRVIISRGWSKLGCGSPNTDDVFYLGDCPYEWLFKRVSAVVHHGAGTTACGLVNARPTIIVPFFGDQPLWGRVIAGAGAGPMPIPQKELTVERLAAGIQLCHFPGTQDSVQKVADMMRQDSGANTAVESFHRRLPLDNLVCDFLPDQHASWIYETKYNAGRKQLKVSNQAASYIVEAKKA